VALAPQMAARLVEIGRRYWRTPATDVAALADWPERLLEAVMLVASVAAPLLVAIAGVALLTHLMQTGFAFRVDRIGAARGTIGVRAWLRTVFSLAHFGQAILAVTASAVALVVAWFVVRGHGEVLVGLGTQAPASAVDQFGAMIVRLIAAVGAVLIAFGAIEFALVRWMNYRQMLMTDEELRQEQRLAGDHSASATRRQGAQRGLGPVIRRP
jgi:flagellar biosynthesis protein FlhB